MTEINMAEYMKTKKPGSTYPFSEDNIEMYLDNLPGWLSLLLLIFFLLITLYLLWKRQDYSILYSFAIGTALSLPLIYLHELSHAWVLKTLNKDTPAVRFGLTPSCVACKPVPLPVFVVNLLAPLWILGVLGILLSLSVIVGAKEYFSKTLSFILIFLTFASAKDLYWLHKLRKIPHNRIVLCGGLTATVRRMPEYKKPAEAGFD